VTRSERRGAGWSSRARPSRRTHAGRPPADSGPGGASQSSSRSLTDGFDCYVHQRRDMKLSVEPVVAPRADLAVYGRPCGATVARAHARAGDPARLAGYLGRSAVFDDALASSAVEYADQHDRDHVSLLAVIRADRLDTPACSG
jgi:hypothetical protein